MSIIDIDLEMKKLAQRRRLFVSEADFQHELALLLREDYPQADIRLE